MLLKVRFLAGNTSPFIFDSKTRLLYFTSIMRSLRDKEPKHNVEQKSHLSFTGVIIKWWLLEALSLFVSAFSMGAIVVVLSLYDGKETPHLYHKFTINGFIAVFSTLTKGALLFPVAKALAQLKFNWFGKEPRTLLDFEIIDAASRGPWGAVEFLARTRQLYVVILTRPFETFVTDEKILQFVGIFWGGVDIPYTTARPFLPATRILSIALDASEYLYGCVHAKINLVLA
jgi:hypothetical protein